MRKFWIMAFLFGVIGLFSAYSGGRSEIKGSSDKKPKAVMTAAPKAKEKVPTKAMDERPMGYNPDLRYDPDFQVNYDVTQISGYKVVVEKRGNPFTMFYDKETEHWNIGTYNYERQYWVWTLPHFNPSVVDLDQLYTKIDLSKTELNRLKPDILSIWGYIEAEKRPYDFSGDPEFSRFIDYLKKQKVPENIVDDYIHLASNPGKRGAALPLGHYYEESEVGFQHLHLVHNTPDDPSDNNESFIVGGMELYFRLHNFDFVPSFKGATYIFRDKVKKGQAIPLKIVEIYPPDKKYTGNFKGQAFYDDVKKKHEEKFGVEFDVTHTSITTDYKALIAKPGQSPFIIMDKMLDSQIHDQFGTEQMYLYYFTDRQAFSEVDRVLTHPRIFGAYVTDWERNWETYFHELGHVLSLYHHFDSTPNASKKEAHLSRPCLMNYRAPFVSDYYCPLCTYSLGIDFRPGP